MNERATFAAIAAFWLLALGHAVVTWPASATLVVFAGGAAAATALEVAAARLGLQRFEGDLALAGVAAWIPLVRPASVYAAYRAAAIALDGSLFVAGLAAGIVGVAALRTDPDALDAGLWSFPPSGASALRHRGVPWWRFAARFAVAFALSLAVRPLL